MQKNSGYQDYILRPLSARLLPEEPGRKEKVKSSGNCYWPFRVGAGKIQIELAEHYGISDYAPPAGGCLLTDPMFAKRLKDLFNHHRGFSRRDIELLKFGRHFRMNEQTKIVVGRNRLDNEAIQTLTEEGDITIYMTSFRGPTVLIPGGGDTELVYLAAALCARYSDAPKDEPVAVTCLRGSGTSSLEVMAAAPESVSVWII